MLSQNFTLYGMIHEPTYAKDVRLNSVCSCFLFAYQAFNIDIHRKQGKKRCDDSHTCSLFVSLFEWTVCKTNCQTELCAKVNVTVKNLVILTRSVDMSEN